MEIIIELSLCINLFLNSFILKITALILKERAKLWFCSALIGSCLSIISPFFMLSPLTKFLLILATSIIMLTISFNFKSFKHFFTIWLIFVLATFIFGGGMTALENIVGQYPLFIVVVIGSIIYFAVKMVLRIQQKANIIKNFTYSVKIKDNGQEISEEGFLDSGNMLYDTITKKPVILVTYDVFHKLYKNISLPSILTKTLDKSSIKNGHYIKINSIGSGTSLLVFTIDEMLVGSDKSFKDVMVGLSFSGFEKSFGKKVLLHSELV